MRRVAPRHFQPLYLADKQQMCLRSEALSKPNDRASTTCLSQARYLHCFNSSCLLARLTILYLSRKDVPFVTSSDALCYHLQPHFSCKRYAISVRMSI